MRKRQKCLDALMLDLLLPSRTHRDHDRFIRECARARCGRRCRCRRQLDALFESARAHFGCQRSAAIARSNHTVQGVHYRKPVAHVQSPTSRHQRRAQPRATVRPGHFDSRPSDPVASSASFLGHCSAASASATSCFGASRAHEYFITGGTKVRRYKDEIDQEFRPSTYLVIF